MTTPCIKQYPIFFGRKITTTSPSPTDCNFVYVLNVTTGVLYQRTSCTPTTSCPSCAPMSTFPIRVCDPLTSGCGGCGGCGGCNTSTISFPQTGSGNFTINSTPCGCSSCLQPNICTTTTAPTCTFSPLNIATFIFYDICDQTTTVVGESALCSSVSPTITCSIANTSPDDSGTIVSVCSSGIIEGTADDYMIVTSPTSSTNLLFYRTDLGILRAGTFTLSDLTALTTGPNAAFGVQTQSTGIGSLAFGNDTTTTTISASGDGSQANGHTETDGIIHSISHGSKASGYATESGKVESTGYGSEASGYATGSFLCGNVTTSSTIDSLGNGSKAFGVADNSGHIQSGTNAHGSVSHGYSSGSSCFDNTTTISRIETGETSYGSVSHGYTNESGHIATGKNAHGSEASGFASGINAEISTDDNSYGARASGYAVSGSQILAMGTGSFAHGVADGDLHEAIGEGSVVFGVNSKSSGNWTSAFGNKALAYMQGSFAHSSYEGLDMGGGDCQYIRIGLKQAIQSCTGMAPTITAISQLELANGLPVSLPFEGHAFARADIIGSRGSSANLCFTVTNSSGIYTFAGVTVTCQVGAATYTPIPETDGFVIEISQTETSTVIERYCATLHMTMINDTNTTCS